MTRQDRMRRDYQRFTAAEGYIIGFNIDDIIYGVKLDKIPKRYTRVQRETKSNGGGYGLYICVNTKKVKNELLKKAFAVGTMEELFDGTYNKGVMFEKMIYEHFGQEFRGKDRVPFYQSGDIVIDGKEIQIKYLHARICYDRTLTKLKKGVI